jgi:hypothetical protein
MRYQTCIHELFGQSLSEIIKSHNSGALYPVSPAQATGYAQQLDFDEQETGFQQFIEN